MGHACPMLCNPSPAKVHGKSVCAGCSSSPRHNSWPGAVHVLPTSLLQPLMRLAQSFVMARPDMPDCPVVYASQRFLDLTGYPRCAFQISACKCSFSMPASSSWTSLGTPGVFHTWECRCSAAVITRDRTLLCGLCCSLLHDINAPVWCRCRALRAATGCPTVNGISTNSCLCSMQQDRIKIG